jgi:hypothetical protein
LRFYFSRPVFGIFAATSHFESTGFYTEASAASETGDAEAGETVHRCCLRGFHEGDEQNSLINKSMDKLKRDFYYCSIFNLYI